MVTILIAIFVSVGLFILAGLLGSEGKSWEFIALSACVIAVVLVFMGTFVPLQGYEEKLEFVDETELISLSNDLESQGSKGIFYVSISADNVYSYRYEVENEYDVSGKSYKIGTVSKNVTEVESNECKVPTLRTYIRKAKRGPFTFAIASDETEYVFYVPEGTIIKEVSLC